MFDPRTAELLQSAPGVPGLEADDLPKALTRAYARLVSDRLEGGDGEPEVDVDDPWSVDRIADTYEIIASLEEDPTLRRAAAFVAGTAQQIIARRVQAADHMVVASCRPRRRRRLGRGSAAVPSGGAIRRRERGRWGDRHTAAWDEAVAGAGPPRAGSGAW